MLKKMTIRTTSTFLAYALVVMLLAGAVVLAEFAPIWAVFAYVWMVAISIGAKMYFIGLPGTRRFNRHFAG